MSFNSASIITTIITTIATILENEAQEKNKTNPDFWSPVTFRASQKFKAANAQAAERD